MLEAAEPLRSVLPLIEPDVREAGHWGMTNRADNVRKRNYFARYEGVARQVLEGLLDKYGEARVIDAPPLGGVTTTVNFCHMNAQSPRILIS